MTHFKVIKLSDSWWSLDKLCKKVEKLLGKMSAEGYEIVSVSFTTNYWQVHSAIITVSLEIK